MHPGQAQYGNNVALHAYDSEASTCLEVNPGQQGYSDLFRLVGNVVAGAYTTVSTAYNANVSNANKRKRIQAVEDVVSILLGPEFAAT